MMFLDRTERYSHFFNGFDFSHSLLVIEPRLSTIEASSQALHILHAHGKHLEVFIDTTETSFYPITSDEFAMFVANTFCFGLAYGPMQASKTLKETPESIAIHRRLKEFTSTLPNATYFCNGEFNHGGWGWQSFTDATFDACVVAYNHETIAVFAIADED